MNTLSTFLFFTYTGGPAAFKPLFSDDSAFSTLPGPGDTSFAAGGEAATAGGDTTTLDSAFPFPGDRPI